MKKILAILITFSVLPGLLQIDNRCSAQDIHFSQFYFSPLTLNPAQTGFFFGKYRFAANYRNQWSKPTGGFPYTTYSASVDMHVLENLMRFSDALGIGFIFHKDEAGSGSFGTTSFMGSVAFHKDIGGYGTNFITLGIQGGMVQMGFDRAKVLFPDEIDGDLGAGGGREVIPNSNISYVDVNAGLLWNFVPSEKVNIYAGIASFHLTKPDINFVKDAPGPPNKLSGLFSLQAGAAIAITEYYDLLPSILYMNQDANNELNIGTAIRFNTQSKASVRVGPWYRRYRNSDAMVLFTGVDVEGLNFGISYDFNFSVLRQTSKGQGGVELALLYTLTPKKMKGTRKPSRCPHF